MPTKFEKTTRQLLEMDQNTEKEIARILLWRMLRASFIVRVGSLTLLLSAFLLLTIRPYQVSDLLIVVAGGYTLAINILFINNSLKRVGIIHI